MENTKLLTFARTAFKNLFKKPATVGYPYEPAKFPEGMRGHVEIAGDQCICCGMCMRSCPPGAISVDRAAGTWTIRRFDCVQCGNCVHVCPKKCLTMAPGYTAPDVKKSSETFKASPLPPKPAARPDDGKEAVRPAAQVAGGK